MPKKDNIKFSPSVNILRDYDKDLNYVVTRNSLKIANQIISDFNNHLHSFSVIGSYGTGKSSFLWAFEKNLNNEKQFFFNLNGQFNGLKDFVIVNIVGSYSPFEELLHRAFHLRKEITLSRTLKGIESYYDRVIKKDRFLVIIVDEFGKILEYAAQNSPEERIYFFQQFTEFVNDPDRNILFINTLHQNFNSYSNALTVEQKQEWNKVRGRFVELTFNEPLEQLLFLAADQISKWNVFGLETLFDREQNRAILDSGLLSIPKDFADKIAFQLLPLDTLSATILTQVLKDYGQNERSLFTFLARRGEGSLHDHAHTNSSFSLVDLYDFVQENFYSYLTDKYNRDKSKWDRIRITLDRVDQHFEADDYLAQYVVKVIGLLTIYGNKGGRIDTDFLVKYLKNSKVAQVLEKLSKLKILLYRRHSSTYVLTEGTDLDYYEAIEDAASKVDPIKDLTSYLKKYYSLPVLHAKKVSYEVGTPRFFEFEIAEDLFDDKSVGELDGKIYLVFNSEIEKKEILDFSRNVVNANIYVLFFNTIEIKKTVFEIKKVEFVLANIEHDKVAEKELIKIIESLKNRLNSEVLESLYSKNGAAAWFYNGKEKSVSSERELNKLLSQVADEVYRKTPVIRNELMNKHKLSSAISIARKNLIKALLLYSNNDNLNFPEDKYPPEKTIYQTLIKNTGIHRRDNENNLGFQEPTDPGIRDLWTVSVNFLDDSVNEEKNLFQLFEILSNPPYKLKEGVISFWIPIFLIIKNNEYALFKDGNYIPYLSEELFDILYKNLKIFSIRKYPFKGIEIQVFNKYRELFDISDKQDINNSSVIETIKPFLLFYQGLPEYVKQTESLSPQARNFRQAIAGAKDPYSAFFNDFPSALGYSKVDFTSNNELLEDYITTVRKVINEIHNIYNELIQRIENSVKRTTNIQATGLDIKEKLSARFNGIEIEKLSSAHKRVLSRVRLPFDSKDLWYEALVMAVLDKPLKSINDKEEELFHSSFERIYQDLIDLVPLHQVGKKSDQNIDFSDLLGVKVFKSDGSSETYNAIIDERIADNTTKLKSIFDKEFHKLKLNDKRALLLNFLNSYIEDESGD